MTNQTHEKLVVGSIVVGLLLVFFFLTVADACGQTVDQTQIPDDERTRTIREFLKSWNAIVDSVKEQNAAFELILDGYRKQLPESEIINLMVELRESYLTQSPLTKELDEDYHRTHPLLVIMADDLRSSQRERRLAKWKTIVEHQEYQLKRMKQIRQIHKDLAEPVVAWDLVIDHQERQLKAQKKCLELEGKY